MGISNSSAETWPQDATPRHWVAALFEKMTRMWGNTFLDKWRDVDLEGVMIEWGRGLRKLSTPELKAGVDALMSLKYPPHLPEFYALCKQMRLVEAAQTPQLTDQTKATPEVVDSNLERMQDLMRPLSAAKEPNAEWAFRLVMRGKNSLPYEVARCACDAVTSPAGKLVVDQCFDPELKTEYAALRQTVVDNYRMRGIALWGTK